jgi:transcriptional regulator with XRE-family HTH domain
MHYPIGNRIAEELEKLGMSKAEFGRRIGTSRQNVNTMLRRNDLNTDLLLRICKVLNFNFFLEMASLVPSEVNTHALSDKMESHIIVALHCHPQATTVQALHHLETVFSDGSGRADSFNPLVLDRIFVDLMGGS